MSGTFSMRRLFRPGVCGLAVGLVASAASLVAPPSPAFATTTTYSSAVTASSPDGYWRLGEGTSEYSDEASGGNDLHTAFSAGTTSTTGMELNASGSLARVYNGDEHWDSSDIKDLTSKAVSVELWVNVASPIGARTFYNEASTCNGGSQISIGLDGTGHVGADVRMNDHTLEGGFDSAMESVLSPDPIAAGKWHQIVMTAGALNGSTLLRLYVDGRRVGEITPVTGHDAVATCSYQSGLQFSLGSVGTASTASDTTLDELSYYERVLPLAEILTHWQASGRVIPLSPGQKLGGSNASMPCTSCMLKELGIVEPVDASTGNFYHSFSDVGVPGRGAGLSFGRTYNTALAGNVGPLGHGWTTTWSSYLDVTSDLVTLHQDNGAEATFEPNGAGGWKPSAMVIGSLAYDSGSSTWTLVRDHVETMTFRSDGHLTSWTDPNGYTTTLAYASGTHNLTSVTESTDVSGTPGRSLTLTWSGSYLSSITDPAGRSVTFSVNGTTHDLDSVTDQRGGVTKFTYDSSHRLLTMQSPSQSAAHPSDPTIGAVTNAYDSSDRVTDQWSATATSGASGVNTNPTHFDYSVTDQTTITDPEGNDEIQYYENGFLVSDTKAAGTADEGTWTFEYDALTGGISKVTDPNGFHQTTTWYGDCTGLTDCATGRVHTTQNDLDPATTYTYDSTTGVVKTVTAPDGHSTDTTTTTYTYTNHINPASVSTPLYNAAHTSVVDTQTVSYTHGDSDHPEDVSTMTDPRGKDWIYTYNSYGQQVTATDPLTHGSTTAYDIVGRPTSGVSPKGNLSGANPDQYRSAVVYDDGGFPLVSMASGSYPVVDTFDRSNGSIGTADTGQSWTAVSGAFSVDAKQIKLSTASGTTNMATVATGADEAIAFTLAASQDDFGVVFRQSDTTHYWKLVARPGTNTWELANKSGGSSSVIATTGSSTCCTVGQRVLIRAVGNNIRVYVDGIRKINVNSSTFASNTNAGLFAAATGAGRLDNLSIAKAGAGTTAATYNADGQPTVTVDGSGDVTITDYYASGQPTSTTRPDATTLGYTYDGNGAQTSYTDGAGNTTAYGYDHQGRPSSEQRPGKSATTYSYGYSSSGQTTVVHQPGGGTITRTSDAAGRTTNIDYSSSGTDDVSVTYNHAGNHTSMTTGTGTPSTWTYDSLGRLAASSRASRSVAYGYDISGNRTSITYPGSHTVTEGYDDAGRQTSVDDWVNTAFSFDYDENNNPTVTTVPNGVTSTRTYDATDRPTLISIDHGTTNLQTFTQAYDPESQISQIVSAGTIASTKNYTYNTLGKMLGSGNGFAWDAADNLTWTVNASNVMNYQGFNNSNELCWTATTNVGTCSAPPTGATSYAYDARGNRTTKTPSTGTATTYSYDQGNRLTGISGGLAASYVYDGDGLRLSKTVSSATTTYTWDESGNLPLLLDDGSDDYIYGPSGEPLERITSSGVPTFIHQDHLGSTRILTDSSGAVSGTYTFKATGASPSHTGSASVSLQYAGQYTDSESGFQYLRARYYDPSTGNFLTLDPDVRMTNEGYGYAAGNPISLTDPTGLYFASGGGTSDSVIEVVKHNETGPSCKPTQWVTVRPPTPPTEGASCTPPVNPRTGAAIIYHEGACGSWSTVTTRVCLRFTSGCHHDGRANKNACLGGMKLALGIGGPIPIGGGAMMKLGTSEPWGGSAFEGAGGIRNIARGIWEARVMGAVAANVLLDAGCIAGVVGSIRNG